jgi:hypothetical protein
MENLEHQILRENQQGKLKMQSDKAKFKNQFSEAFLHFEL